MSQLMTPENGESPVDFLELAREKFVKTYIKLGYHKILGMTESEYAESLPKFSPQPESYKGRFDIPILVETRISPHTQTKLLGMDYPLGIISIDWEGDPKGYKTPKKPYTAWMQDGTKNLGIPSDDVRENLSDDERGATEFDAIALYVKKGLDLLINHSVDLPGTDFPPDYAAYMSLDCGRPGLCLSYSDTRNEKWGAATCGR